MPVQVIKVYASEDGPQASTGQPRWKRGERLQLRISNGMVWVCGGAVVELKEGWQGGGLLYTYAAEDIVDVNDKRVNGKGGEHGRFG